MKMISVSQNDGNNTNCSCPACKEVDEYEGSPSGNLIRFLNKLAERFLIKNFPHWLICIPCSRQACETVTQRQHHVV